MNFFKSLISDDPDPLYPENPQDSESDSAENQPLKDHDDDDNDENDVVNDDADDQSAESSGGNMWGFGGLLQTLTTRSESVLEAYKRDLQEFGSGLKKETELFKEVASRAVKDLPASIEVAHGAIDGVIKSTADIISQGRETLLSHPSEDALPPETPERGISIGRYSRYEAQLYTIQNDENTFTEEPEDVEDYNKWKSGFVLTERIEEIEELIGENGALEDMHKRLVFTNEVDQDIFWFRYFYRVDKLKQQESVRANLVRRAISIEDDEEELSWDVDDDDEEDDDENENEKEKEKEKESSQLKPKDDESDNKKESGDLEKDKNVEEESPKNVSVAEESGENKSNVEKEEHEISDLEVKADELDKKVLVNENSNEVEDKSAPNVSVVKESEKTDSNVENIEKANVVSSVEGDEKEKEKEIPKESPEAKNEDKMVVSKESSEVEKSEGKSDQKSVAKEEESEEDMGWDEIEDVSSSDEKKVSAPSKSVDSVDVKKRLSVAEEDDDEDLSWDIEDDDD